jgi:hypothetical protein
LGVDPHTHVVLTSSYALYGAVGVPLRTPSRMLLTHGIICARLSRAVTGALGYRAGLGGLEAEVVAGRTLDIKRCAVDQYKSEQLA